jgi:linoleoyl-CoA desaturase
MKTIKFSTDDIIQKQFVSALRKNVAIYFKENGISTKGNGLMYLKAVVLLTAYILPFIIILTQELKLWQFFLMFLLMGIGEAGVGMSVMHDAAHGAFSTKKWVNSFFASTMFLLGSNTFNWKIQHNILHHTFTNIFGYDQDIETKAVLRLSDHAPLKKFHKYQYVYAFLFYGLMTISKLVTDVGQLIAFNKSGITREQNHNPSIEILKLIIVKLIYFSILIVLPLSITDFVWWQLLIGFSLMHLMAGIIMSTIFQMAHIVDGAEQPLPDKNGVINCEWAVHELNTTSNFAPKNKLLNWYAGGLNYQIEHHLFPNTCHIHYKKIAPIVERTAREFGISYNQKQSFNEALLSHINRLKELGNSKKI